MSTLSRKQILGGFCSLLLIGFYSPVLELILNNPSIREYYSFSDFDFVLIFGVFLSALLAIFAISLRSQKVRTGMLISCICWSALFFVAELPLFPKLGLMLLVLGFCFAVTKNPDGLLKVLAIVSLFLVPEALWKNKNIYKRFILPEIKRSKITKYLELQKDAPQNIVFILLDGTDLTSLYLDNQKLPKKELLPNLHEAFKKEFLWFPESFANSPQTYLSIPIIATGTFEYNAALKRFAEGRDFFSALSTQYDVHNFGFKKYYNNYCKWNETHCYPFKHKDIPLHERGSIAILQTYLHRASQGLISPREKVGKEFVPVNENYTQDEVLSRMTSHPSGRNFFYMHLMRRRLPPLQKFDGEFQRLRAHLVKLGLWDSSMVILTADHGMDFSQTKHHYGVDAEFTTRVFKIPIAIKLPHGQGKVSSFKAQSIDIFPTILGTVFKNSPTGEGINLISEKSTERKVLVNCSNESTAAEFKNDNKVTPCDHVTSFK